MKTKNILAAVFLAFILVVLLMVIFPQKKTGSAVNENMLAEDCGDGTTIYLDESLCWQKSTKPAAVESWQEADSYCEELELGNKEDWRLPEVGELRSVVKEVPPEDPTIDEGYFTNTKPNYFWTGTPYSQKENTHWFIYFKTGAEGIAPDFKKGYDVRCVRDN